MKRREFFGTGANLLAAFALASCRTGLPVSGYSDKKGELIIALANDERSSFIRIMNLDDRSFRDLRVPLLAPHSMLRGLRNPDHLYIFSIQEPPLILDLKSGHTVFALAPSTSEFQGHGVQVSDGDIFWCTELAEKKFIVRPRSSRDFSLIGGPELFFPGGHSVVKLPGTDHLLSGGNQRGESFVSVYNSKDLKLEKMIPVNYDVSHFYPVSATETYAVTFAIKKEKTDFYKKKEMPEAETSPVLWLNTATGEVKELWGQDNRDEFRLGFGTALLPGQRFLTTHTTSGKLRIWKDLDLEKTLDIPRPQSVVVSADASEFIVHADRGLRIHSAKDLTLKEEFHWEKPVIAISAYKS